MTEKQVTFYETRIRNLVDYLPNLFYPSQAPLEIQATTSPEPIPFEDLARGEFRRMSEGEQWGSDWSSAWFRLRGTVPESWEGATAVARLQFQGEACVFSPDGEPLQGLTNGSIFSGSSVVRERFPLYAPCRGGEKVELLVEAAANNLFGIHRDAHPAPNKPYSEGYVAAIECARLCVFDEELFRCWLEAKLLNGLMQSLPARSPQRAQLLHGLTEAANAFDYAAPNPGAVRAVLAPHLARRADDTQLTTVAVGHAHIDTAWLWPMCETIRKCARTFSSQLALTEKHPGYVFGASQPQLYQFVKDRYPPLYERIKKAVADGRWEVQGAMWVEADTNVPGAESLVRQLLYGKRFFCEEFGVDVRNLWLPDVFGYSASLPQILKLAGVETFLTQKISWSQFDRFPHHTFRWRGIDGSEVLTHFPPEDTYNSQLAPARLRYAQDNFEERGFLPEFMTLFGVGDGGGGPLEEHIENGLRQADLANCPRVRFGPAQPMFDRLKQHAEELDVWSGELYLELHRGTLTTQARNKKMNRVCELALRRTEMLYCCLPFAAYPADALERMWKTVLTNQFHDIIPGSSIHRVYEESLQQYHEIVSELDHLTSAAAVALRSGAPAAPAGSLTLLNCLSHDFQDAVFLPNAGDGALRTPDGVVPVQPAANGGAWVPVRLPGLTACALNGGAPPAQAQAPTDLSVAPDRLENARVRYDFDDHGCLVGVLDKESGRDMMRPGERGAVLSLYEDWPHNFDAWEVDLTYESQLREQARLLRARVLETGPYVAAIELRWEIGASSVTQQVRLSAFSKRLDFVTHVDWRECRRMLRVAFPLAIETDEASCEIQYGVCRRPTHRNTSWDVARFEVCAHRFVDLSDKDCGVALLNDCKYGCKTHGRTLDLNLLRAPWHPDPHADRGEHQFTYSLLPHCGALEDSDVVAQAHLLNQPPLVLEGEANVRLPCRISGAGVLLDALKKAEQEDAWVLRLYEPVGRRATCELRTRNPNDEVLETDVMERSLRALETRDGSVALSFRPFEVKTLMVRPG